MVELEFLKSFFQQFLNNDNKQMKSFFFLDTLMLKSSLYSQTQTIFNQPTLVTRWHRKDFLQDLSQNTSRHHEQQLLEAVPVIIFTCWAFGVGGSESGRHAPLLSPSGPLRIRHSSICPNAENMTRMSFSLHFFDTMPMNSFLSSTAAEPRRRGREKHVNGGRTSHHFYSFNTKELGWCVKHK